MGKTQREVEIPATGHTLGIKPQEIDLLEDQTEHYVLDPKGNIVVFVHSDAGMLTAPESR